MKIKIKQVALPSRRKPYGKWEASAGKLVGFGDDPRDAIGELHTLLLNTLRVDILAAYEIAYKHIDVFEEKEFNRKHRR